MITAKPISNGTMLIMSERDRNFCLAPELAPSTSLLASKPISSNMAKIPIEAAKLEAAIVAIVLTVTVETIS